jgi:hypothetical protein
MMYKNEAVLKRTEASDQWAFYQAKSNKQHLAELAAVLAPTEKASGVRSRGRALQEREEGDSRPRPKRSKPRTKKYNDLSEHAMHPHIASHKPPP